MSGKNFQEKSKAIVELNDLLPRSEKDIIKVAYKKLSEPLGTISEMIDYACSWNKKGRATGRNYICMLSSQSVCAVFFSKIICFDLVIHMYQKCI